jgi:hypothetical protein
MSLVRPDIVKRLASLEIQYAPTPISVPVFPEAYPGETEKHARIRHGYAPDRQIMLWRVVDARKRAA